MRRPELIFRYEFAQAYQVWHGVRTEFHYIWFDLRRVHIHIAVLAGTNHNILYAFSIIPFVDPTDRVYASQSFLQNIAEFEIYVGPFHQFVDLRLLIHRPHTHTGMIGEHHSHIPHHIGSTVDHVVRITDHIV